MQLLVPSPRAISRLPQSFQLLPTNGHITREQTLIARNLETSAASRQPLRTHHSLQPAIRRAPQASIPALRLASFKTSTRTMSSDADYASFLDKANQDTGSAQQQSSSSKKNYGTKSVDTAVPQALESVEEYYVSDADEPFEPVALKYSGKSISAGTVPADA